MQELIPWCKKMQGAKRMLHFLQESPYILDLAPGVPKAKGKLVYHKAVYDWLMSDLSNIEHFMNGEEYYFTDHVRDSKGKLIKCSVTLHKPDNI